MNNLKKISFLILIAGFISVGTVRGQAFINFNTESVNKVELYPNPATNYLTIEIKNSKLVKPYILLHSIIGNSIKIETDKISDNKYRIEVKDLPNGYYLLSVKDPGTKFSRTYKFLKK